ncbi:MAG: hypothetical protein RRY95_01510 [Oscillospiraceae bacterium]
MEQSSFSRRVIRAALGLLLAAVATLLMVRAGIGLAPWDVLSMGLSYHLPITYGQATICISVLILLVDVALKEEVGVGTILDAVLVGWAVDVYIAMDLVPVCKTLGGGLLMMTVGMVILGAAQAMYMSAGLSCGPRDALLVALGKRLRWLPIGAVQILIQAAGLLVGLLLGGPAGVGTVVAVFGSGMTMQLVFRLLHFEPREVQHEGLQQTLARMKKQAAS